MTAKAPSLWRRDVIGWSLYDFANTIYSMNILSRYMKLWVVEDLGYGDGWFDIPYAISMAIAALLLPALGAMSDHGAKKRLFLFLFTVTCCLSLGFISIVPTSAVLLIVALFAVSNFAYEAGAPFYNALLYSVAEGRQARFVSGIGVSLGYVGSILGIVLVMPFVYGDVFGMDIPFLDGGGKAASLVPTAVLFSVFTIPLFLWVKERPSHLTERTSLRDAYREVWHSVKATKRYPGVLRFLIADYFFEDAAATVIINISAYLTLVVGLADSDLDFFLIVSTTSAVVGSLLVGKLAEYMPLKTLLRLVVWGWIICLVVFVSTENMTLIWVLGSLVGIVLGGLWTVTRPLLAELVPKEELGRFFGLFSLSGRAAAVVGPIMWTTVVFLFQAERPLGSALGALLGASELEASRLPYRVGILSLVAFMIVGLIILRKVPVAERGSDA